MRRLGIQQEDVRVPYDGGSEIRDGGRGVDGGIVDVIVGAVIGGESDVWLEPEEFGGVGGGEVGVDVDEDGEIFIGVCQWSGGTEDGEFGWYWLGKAVSICCSCLRGPGG